MKIAYLGSGDIGLPTLRALLQDARHEAVAVITQPDRPVGRHQQTLQASPIKALALAAGKPVLQPERIRRPEAVEAVRALEADVFVVFAYGQILPPAVLSAPRLACLNLHASLLPRWRGAAPIQAAIAAGDRESGLTVMFMDAGLDTGDILLEKRFPLRRRETGGSLHDRLAELAPSALLEALELLAAERAPRQPQDHSLATLAPKLDRESGRLLWTLDHRTLDRRIRAMHPWPGAFTTLPNADAAGASPMRPLTLKIHSALPVRRCAGQPGEVVHAGGRGILAAAGSGGLLLREVQLEGKRRMSAAEFLRGHPLPPGARFGE
jgi:methionyl-tRNA formyltransferase